MIRSAFEDASHPTVLGHDRGQWGDGGQEVAGSCPVWGRGVGTAAQGAFRAEQLKDVAVWPVTLMGAGSWQPAGFGTSTRPLHESSNSTAHAVGLPFPSWSVASATPPTLSADWLTESR
jgi:hypothetical protein